MSAVPSAAWRADADDASAIVLPQTLAYTSATSISGSHPHCHSS